MKWCADIIFFLAACHKGFCEVEFLEEQVQGAIPEIRAEDQIFWLFGLSA